MILRVHITSCPGLHVAHGPHIGLPELHTHTHTHGVCIHMYTFLFEMKKVHHLISIGCSFNISFLDGSGLDEMVDLTLDKLKNPEPTAVVYSIPML